MKDPRDSLDPIERAAVEVEEVIEFVRRAVPAFKRVTGELQGLVGFLRDETSSPPPPVYDGVCLTCVGTGLVGADLHKITCPLCLGKGMRHE